MLSVYCVHINKNTRKCEVRIKHHFCNLISFSFPRSLCYDDDKDDTYCTRAETDWWRGKLSSLKRRGKESKGTHFSDLYCLQTPKWSVLLLFPLLLLRIPWFKSKLMQKCQKRGKLNVILWVMDEWMMFGSVCVEIILKRKPKNTETLEICPFLWMLLLLLLNIIIIILSTKF